MEPGFGNMGVDLSRGETLVAKQFLHDTKVRATFEQVRGVSVAKRVWVDVPSRDPVVENSPDVARPEAISTTVEEKRLSRGILPDHLISCVLQPEANRVETLLMERNDPLLAALSHDPEQALIEVDAVQIEIAQFTHAKSGSIEDLADRPVEDCPFVVTPVVIQ